MCGRFYVDDEMMEEIGRICRRIDGKLPKAGDVHPSEPALILRAEKEGLAGAPFLWGYQSGGKLIFNARSETVCQRPLFRSDYENGRCVIPARRFYEWTAAEKGKKAQYDFYRPEGLLFLAGICHREQDGGRFTVLTTEANASVREVHGRMPVLLREEEIGAWLQERSEADRILDRVPQLLEKKRSGGPAGAYDQLRLF